MPSYGPRQSDPTGATTHAQPLADDSGGKTDVASVTRSS